jgi:hypothetical protein
LSCSGEVNSPCAAAHLELPLGEPPAICYTEGREIGTEGCAGKTARRLKRGSIWRPYRNGVFTSVFQIDFPAPAS